MRPSSSSSAPDLATPTTPTRRDLGLHLATLGAAAAVLVWTARGAQFYWDDWALLAVLTRGDDSLQWYLSAHNEHWILVPRLASSALFHTVGAGSALPWVGLTVSAHLVLCHLLWRIALRGGCPTWAATTAAAGFAVYAAGVENVLFPVQVGLVGCLALGAGALLELRRPRPRPLVVIGLTTVMVLTFGLAPVLLLLAGVLLLVTRRVRLAWQLLPATLAFATWYLAYHPRVSGRPTTGAELATLPVYWLLGVGNGVSSIVPWRPVDEVITPAADPTGALLALGGALALGILVLVGSRLRPRPHPVVWLFLLGGPVVMCVLGSSRISYGFFTALFSRYVYVVTAFLLPFVVTVLARSLSTTRVGRGAAVATVGGVAAANLVVWPAAAAEWTSTTQRATRVLVAARDLARQGQPLAPEMAGTAELAFMTRDDLLRLDLSSAVGRPTDTERLSAVLAAQVVVDEALVSAVDCEPPLHEVRIPMAVRDVVLSATGNPFVELRVEGSDGVSSPVATRLLTTGGHRVRFLADHGVLVVSAASGSAVLARCRS